MSLSQDTGNRPDCSVLLFTYNQVDFIEQCIRSCIEQDTDYTYEILIGEDGSSDGTRDICIDYANQYPELIRLFLNSRKDVIHINGRPTGRWNIMNLINHATGRYFAIIAGDDYWSSRNKLQEQIAFLDNRPDYTICHTAAMRLFVNGGEKIGPYPHERAQSLEVTDILKHNDILTSSAMYRNGVVTKYPEWIYYTAPMLDWPLNIMHAMHGKAWRIDEPMCVYRIHQGGIWMGQKQAQRSREYLEFCEFLKENVLPERLHKALGENIFHLHYRIAYSSYNDDKDSFILHRKYCVRNAGFSIKRLKQAATLFFMQLGLVKYNAQTGRLSIG